MHATPTHLYDAYIFDLDGTIYLGDALLPTVLDTLTALRAAGRRTVFLSNNPTRPRTVYAEKLSRLGVSTPVEDVINSSAVMVLDLKSITQRVPRLYPSWVRRGAAA